MKKMVRLFLCAFALVCLSISCTKDGENLVGEWHATKVHYVERQNGQVINESDSYYGKESSQMILILEENKTCQMISVDEGNRYVQDGTWVYTGNKLMITSEYDGVEETDIIDVQSVTKKEMICVVKESEEHDGVNWEYISTFYFTRQ